MAKKSGPRNRLLEKPDFRIVETPADLEARKDRRGDFSFIIHESLTKAIDPQTIFLLAGDQKTESSFLADPVVVNMPAVKSKQVYGLGSTSFRIDYYSGKQIIDAVVKRLDD